MIFNKIVQYIKEVNSLEKIIILIVVVFIPGVLLPYFVIEWGALPNHLGELLFKPWTIISYSFVHVNFLHFIFNLLVLYYIGNIFLDFFTEKQFLIYYFSGVVVGGIFFYLLGLYLPQKDALIGASAGITSLMMGLTAKVPNYKLNFRFIGFINLWILSLIWILISIFGLYGVQAGGAVAHLGGGLIGFILTYYSLSINKQPKKKNNFKKIYVNPKAKEVKMSYRNSKNQQEQVDAILDKISKSGYDSLSKEEKEFLFNQRNHD